MASGDTLGFFSPLHNEPPASNYATLDLRNNHPLLAFDASTDESAVFTAVMPDNYDGGGVTVTLIWTSTATAGNCIWDASFEANAASFDIDADSFAAVQSVTDAAPGNSGELQYASISFTDGAQMDSVAANELFRLKITRDANNGSDDMAADAQLIGVLLRES